jgi:hypothetical protein
MAIMVHYKGDTFGYIAEEALEEMIVSHSIVAFRRNDGWAEIGKDPLRSRKASTPYDGLERRKGPERASCLICKEFTESQCQANTCQHRTSLQGKTFKS